YVLICWPGQQLGFARVLRQQQHCAEVGLGFGAVIEWS
ncbi:hypothetical protein CCACVL1_27661, partial [Corchorus capsularis]